MAACTLLAPLLDGVPPAALHHAVVRAVARAVARAAFLDGAQPLPHDRAAVGANVEELKIAARIARRKRRRRERLEGGIGASKSKAEGCRGRHFAGGLIALMYDPRDLVADKGEEQQQAAGHGPQVWSLIVYYPHPKRPKDLCMTRGRGGNKEMDA